MRFPQFSPFLFLFLLIQALFGLTVKDVLSNPGSVEISLSVEEFSLIPRDEFFDISIPNCGYRGNPGSPSLAGKSFYVALPKGEIPEVFLDVLCWSDWYDIIPSPVPDFDSNFPYSVSPSSSYNNTTYALAELKETGTFRGVYFAMIDYIPVEYNPRLGVRFALVASLRISFSPIEIEFDERYLSPVFEKLLRSFLVNPDDALPEEPCYFTGPWHSSQGAELLVISLPAYASGVEAWAELKHTSGIPTRVVTTSVTGTTRDLIKAYIQNAYDTWEIPPSYILFVGDADEMPTNSWANGGVGDGPYGCVDGDDYFPDILTGRFSCDNVTQLAILIRKALNFENSPDTTDDWFARAVGVVREDGPPYGPVDSSYNAAVGYAMEQCSLAGFSSSPVFRRSLGHTSTNVQPFISAGCSFVSYRGQAAPDWYGPFSNLHSLATGVKCPITVSITCFTGGFHSSDNNLCEVSTRAGTVDYPQGSVAWIGQGVASSYSIERSSLSKHIFEGFFEAGLNELSAAHLYGKNEMLAEFGPTYAAEAEYKTTTLVGSPEMRAWTAQIAIPEVVCLPAISPTESFFDVFVYVDGAPRGGLRAALSQDTLMSFAFTDAFGSASIEFTPLPDPTLPILLAVTGANIYPHFDFLDLALPGVLLWPAPVVFSEISGNGDTFINPGETFSFQPRIINLGVDTALGLSGRIIMPWDFIWDDSLSDFPAAATFDTVAGNPLAFTVPEDYPAAGSLSFKIYIEDHPDGPWLIEFPNHPKVHRFKLEVDSIVIADNPPYGDDNGKIDPGETVDICIRMKNPGNGVCDSLFASFFPNNDSIAIVSNTARAGIWESLETGFLSPCFTFDISPELHYVPARLFDLHLEAYCNTYSYAETIEVPLSLREGILSVSPWLHYIGEPLFIDLGDGDGILEPGERIGIILNLKNSGSATAYEVFAGISATPFIYSDGHSAFFGDIPSDAVITNTLDAITCSTAHYTPTDTILEVPILLMESTGGYSHAIKVFLPIGTPSQISEKSPLPKSISIGNFHPNPFNSSGEFEIYLPDSHEDMRIEAYNITGRRVQLIHDGAISAGQHKFIFTPPNSASGLYLIRIRVGAQNFSLKAVFLE